MIDEWTGHATEEQRKRYRHLYPSTQQAAILSVFGEYPKAALLAFCIALLTYNVVSTIKAGMRSAHRDPTLLSELSTYYLAEEISAMYSGMMVAIAPRHWTKQFAHCTPQELAACLRELALNADPKRFRKRRRGPHKPPPKRTGGLREKHVSTQRLLDRRNPRTKRDVTA